MSEIILEKRYIIKWQLKGQQHYKITECRNIINCKTNRLIKRTVVGTSVGYWIGKKFIPIKRMNEYCEKTTKEETPF